MQTTEHLLHNVLDVSKLVLLMYLSVCTRVNLEHYTLERRKARTLDDSMLFRAGRMLDGQVCHGTISANQIRTLPMNMQHVWHVRESASSRDVLACDAYLLAPSP